jgi:hypothetical protein
METTDLQPPKAKLPWWAEEVLATCPTAGNGVHKWLFVTALKLHRHCPDKEELASLLDTAVSGCGREVSSTEIENAVRDSQRIVESESNSPQINRPRWASRDEELIRKIISEGPNLEKLRAMSPVRWDDDAPHTEDVIDRLFPGDPLLCAGTRNTMSLTRTREEWRGFLQKQQFIVPRPMAAVYGRTRNGEQSMRTLANVGPRRFVVVEFDQGVFDEHSALLIHLGRFAPLVLVVHSGGKSLHGWFCCAGQPDEKVEKFFRYAVSIGADPATWTPCQ